MALQEAYLVVLVVIGGAGVAASCRPPIDESGQPRRPSDWHWLQRTYPHYSYDVDAIPAALRHRASMVQTTRKRASSWVAVGPTDIGGRIVDIEFNPKDGDDIFIAAATGGVFRSRDAGNSWTSLFDDQAVLTIGDFALDPVHPDTIYVGTGEANGGHNNSPGAGIYRSVDGGATWTEAGLRGTASIGRVVVDPVRTNRVFVAAVGSYFGPTNERGVYRSDDHGASWQRTLFVNDSTGVIDLAINQRSPDTLFAATWERVRRPSGSVYLYGEGSAVWRSSDGGVTWEKLSAGLPDPEQNRDATGRPRFGRIGLSVSQSNPNVVYALYVDGQTNGYFGLFRSDDGGDSWFDADPARGATAAFADFSWYFGRVHVSPTDENNVFVLDQQLATSIDGGSSWSVRSGTHVDHHVLAFSPDGSVVLNGNDGGLARSLDSGATWSRLGALPITQFYEIAFDPSDPSTLFGGTQDNGTIKSGGMASDDWSQILGGDGFYVAVDPEDQRTVYAESQYGDLYRIDETGYAFIKPSAASATNWSTPFALHPRDSQVLLYGARRLFRSLDRGNSWAPISPLLGKNTTGRLGTISALAYSSIDTEVVVAGTDDGNVWVSVDGGSSWLNRSAGLPNRWVTRVVPGQHDAGVIYVSFSGLKWRDAQAHVFRSTDFGLTWENAAGGLPDSPVNALAESPHTEGLLFAGLDVGAFYSEDGGSSWNLLGAGLPAVAVYDLKIEPVSNVLIAGTHGRSMYTYPIGDAPTDVQTVPRFDDIELSVYPNPFSNYATMEFTLEEPAESRGTVFDLQGRRIRALGSTEALGRQIRYVWDGETDSGTKASSGTYIIQVEVRSGESTVKRTALVARIN